jgi:hypothetical protein
MSRASDLVQDTKLATRFQDSLTIHTFREVDAQRGRFNREERWKRERHLGRGGFGHVYVESCIAGKRRDVKRAVKIIHKPSNVRTSQALDRELEAIAKFSHDRVSDMC